MEEKRQYNSAKFWQIGFFSLNNAAANLYLALMGYISYYANSIAGFRVVLISGILTALNVFDAVTDPIVGTVWKIPSLYAVRQSADGSQYNTVVLCNS